MAHTVDGSDSCRTTPTPRPTSSRLSSRSGIRCDCQYAQIVTKFCTTHDIVCCAECCFDKHRECTVKQLKTVITEKGVLPKEEQTLVKQLDSLRRQRQIDLQNLLREKDAMPSQIHEVYKRVKSALDDSEKDDVEKGARRFEKFNTNIQEDIEACTNKMDALKTVQTSENKESHFILCRQAKKLASQIKDNSGTERLQYLAESSTDQRIKSTRVGYFLGENCIEVSYRGRFIIANDDEGCIPAICELPDGSLIVVCDRLVQVDENYRPICETDIAGIVSDICCIDDERVALCVKSKKYEGLLQIVKVSTVGKTLTVGLCKQPSVVLGFIGHRMAHTDRNLLIKDFKNVYTCTDMGKKESTFFEGQTDEGIIDIKTNPSGSKVYIAERERGVVVLDNTGKILFTVADPDLHDMCSICVDTKGLIFVACNTTRRVLLFGENGQKHGLVISLKRVGEPMCIALHTKVNRLLITIKDSGELRVYDM